MAKRLIALLLCVCICVGMVSMLAGCKKKADAFVIMTEQLDGLFNPFFYTSANDGNIVALTQISMLGADYEGGEVKVAYGENQAVVVLNYDEKHDAASNTTVYTFVLKNGIKFSDGQPLTMEDVLFNYYVYLDPVYTGSNTLYSTAIQGLNQYRTQQVSADSSTGDMIDQEASTRAKNRMNELVELFKNQLKASSTKEVSKDAMTAAINKHSVTSGYKKALSSNASEVTNKHLLADYEHALELFREELERDYLTAQESYKDAPYKGHKEFENEIFCFMFSGGFVEVTYGEDAKGKKDYNNIKTLKKLYPDSIKTKDDAINYIFNDKIARELDSILSEWATADTLLTEYKAKAKEVYLHENITGDTLVVPNISGLVSLGHTNKAGSKIKVNGTEYTIASGHNADGTVSKSGEYDVLQITIDGVDPKAIWNFGITIAPQHYYGEGSKVGMDIAKNKFGVEFASFKFMTEVIQSTRNIKIPMGAGSYKATDSQNSDNPSESSFYTDNVVYFKANNYFETVGAELSNAKIEKVRYQVVSSNNAIAALENGTVHYISPALTTDNYEKLEKLGKKGMVTLSSDQLGYGYIGVNAAKINDPNLRKAIMCAMNTSLALDYYRAGTAEQIYWNMSTVSWAYPKDSANDNGHDYPQMGNWSDETARINIKKYMQAANVAEGDSKLKVTFTIAGSSLQDHPTYKVFRDAQTLLNSMGWNVEVVCDSQALTKINTGSLEVWAAAWSSALDPDMYQVYHKNSSATSTLAWGYNYLKNSGTVEEKQTLNDLSKLIDEARATTDKTTRAKLYKEAMGYILDLAIELPVYQRDVLYAYNSKVIKSESVESDVNPYSSPLDRIWEIEFAK